MPRRDWEFRIQDILGALAAIRGYCEGMDFAAFTDDRRTVDAVLCNLMIIGEAAGHLPDAVCDQAPALPWAEMRALRNFIVHEYFGVSDAILWDTVRNDLPGLDEPLRALLAPSE